MGSLDSSILALLTIAICSTIFLISLDFSIIATAIPAITSEFHTLEDVGWYGSSYLLTTASSQLLFGKFYSTFSTKWVFLVALLIFEIGSALCGAAPNSVALILGRAIAGSGNAGLLSGALLIMTHSVPLERRPLFMAMTGGTYGIAAIAGPPLGGVFTDKLSWRWCFYINLPIGAVTFIRPVAETFIGRLKRFDPLGTIVFMPAVICILLALQWGGTAYAWQSGNIIALFVVFTMLLLACVIIQWRAQENATVPPRIIKNRMVWSCAIYQLTLGAGFFIFVYYVPMWFQAVQGVSAIESGKRNLPMLVGNIIATTISGIAVTAIGQFAPFMILGTILTPVGGGLLTLFNPATTTAEWIGYQALVGIGIGLGWQQPIIAIQAAVSIEDVPTATAILSFAQTLGGSLFISVAQTAFTNKLTNVLATTVPDLDPSVVLDGGAANLAGHVPEKYLPAVLLGYNVGLRHAYIVGTAMAALSLFGSACVEWKSFKGKKIETGIAA
ncbi:putative efflux pump antibiotic resistance protein [Aspergillus avenaceus]|uniref:Putative efflux pump antibiotic resistance protein n=1 Tax=Aspergillus avenaceus TaxID=36643 RepID=A0A5N6TLT7_ASPAV|nr:putative efflux pump antibiotic resistance protein [Aspergillus avenaceus]